MKQILQPAKQQRSQKTQERILRATERLLKKHSFDSISVRRIVKEADTTIGSFYARFRDKDALLPVLYANYEAKLTRELARLEQALTAAKSMEAAAHEIVKHVVDLCGESPNLSRALFEYATRSPHSRESKELSQRRMQQYSFVCKSLLKFANEIQHPDPRRATELGVYFVVVCCRNRLFYPLAPQTRALQISKAELHSELVRMLTGYLRG